MGTSVMINAGWYKGLDHYLEDSTVRAEMLDTSDVFLRQALGVQ